MYEHIALWTAVALNVFATCVQLRLGVWYRRRIKEVNAIAHDLHNVRALMAEHIPVERLRPPQN